MTPSPARCSCTAFQLRRATLVAATFMLQGALLTPHSLRLHLGVVDDLPPLLLFGFQPRRQLFRRPGDGREELAVEKALAEFVLAEQAADLAVDLHHRVARSSRRREQAEPGYRLVTRQAAALRHG